MEGALKSKQSRNIRIFDVVIAIFVAALTVFVVMQAIKLEALRYEIKLVKETKPKRHQGSLFKTKDWDERKRFVRSIVENGKEKKVLENMFRTLDMYKKELIGKHMNKTKICQKIVCKGQKGDPGPRGLKGDTGHTVFAGAVRTAEKGQKGDIGARGPPGPSLEKPRIVEGPSDVTGNEGGSVRFSCESHGNPMPDVIWMINGEKIQSKDERFKINGNGRLQIINLQARDTGVVQCKAKNYFGESAATAKLTVNTYPSVIVQPREIFIDVGTDAEIKCSASGIPSPKISWKKVNGHRPENADLPGNAKVTDGGSLAFQKIQEIDKGTYECIAENAAGKAVETVILFVRVPPAVKVQSREILSYTGNEETELVCKISGLPKPDITWHKLNGKLPANAVVNEEGNLVLKNLSTSDAGVYKCIGKNDLGTSEGLTEVRVQAMSNGMRPRDCKGVLTSGNTESGRYLIWLDGFTSVPVFCDMETDDGGWTVIQRRLKDGISFDRNWAEYRKGFGDLEGSFWLGLDNIHQLTRSGAKLRIDLEDFTGEKVYALYDLFRLGNEEANYPIQVYQFSGNATDSLSYHNNMQFSTKDRDNDKHDSRHCAVYYSGGWWYRGCHKSNLNGIYPTDSQNYPEAISWYYLRGRYGFIKTTEMKIRNGV